VTPFRCPLENSEWRGTDAGRHYKPVAAGVPAGQIIHWKANWYKMALEETWAYHPTVIQEVLWITIGLR
jgi:hypothetical protein